VGSILQEHQVGCKKAESHKLNPPTVRFEGIQYIKAVDWHALECIKRRFNSFVISRCTQALCLEVRLATHSFAELNVFVLVRAMDKLASFSVLRRESVLTYESLAFCLHGNGSVYVPFCHWNTGSN